MPSLESVPTPLSQEAPNMSPLQLTDNAINYIKNYLSKKQDIKGDSFRIAIEGGGCSGYQYNFCFDLKKEDDLVVICGDIKVLVDPQSKLFLNGSVVDYTDDFRGSGFVVNNPNSKGSCGCGVSFSV